MSHWMYVSSNKSWWRSFGSRPKDNDKLWITDRGPVCERCNEECTNALMLDKKLMCESCQYALGCLDFSVINSLLKREIYSNRFKYISREDLWKKMKKIN